MAIVQLENATYTVTTDWRDETESKQQLKRGFMLLNNTGKVINNGSVVDVSGVLFQFTSDEDAGSPGAANTYYLRLETSSSPVLSYTTSAPVYDYGRKGYYYSSTQRALMRFYWNGSAASSTFTLYSDPSLLLTGDLEVQGSADIDGSLSVGTSTSVGSSLSVGTSTSVGSTLSVGSTTTLSGELIPKTGSTYSSKTINVGTSWTPPRGIYFITGAHTRGSFYPQIWDGVTWQSHGSQWSGGTFITDGSRLRIRNDDSINITVRYFKF